MVGLGWRASDKRWEAGTTTRGPQRRESALGGFENWEGRDSGLAPPRRSLNPQGGASDPSPI